MNDLIEALQIMLKFGDVKHPTHCEHDTLYIFPNSMDFTEEEFARLNKLGFHKSDDGGFYSFKYGSCWLTEKELLELANELLQESLELAQYASYAEIVGGISVNKNQVRRHCDNIFELRHKLPKDENYEPVFKIDV